MCLSAISPNQNAVSMPSKSRLYPQNPEGGLKHRRAQQSFTEQMKEGTIKQEGMLWDQEEGLREKAGLTGREKAGKSNVTTQRGRGSARP